MSTQRWHYPPPRAVGPPKKSFLSSVSLWASQNITPLSPTEWGMNTHCSEVLLYCLPPKPGGQMACVGVTSLNPMVELKATSEQGWSHTQASDVCLWACSLYACTCNLPVWLHIRAAKLTLPQDPKQHIFLWEQIMQAWNWSAWPIFATFIMVYNIWRDEEVPQEKKSQVYQLDTEQLPVTCIYFVGGLCQFCYSHEVGNCFVCFPLGPFK